ncbi:MAG: hypothetical protein KKD77_20515 [Gammaproteobacteria bacterium]|nr:hypothetical protein [Gammaproteobacteria bacterium]
MRVITMTIVGAVLLLASCAAIPASAPEMVLTVDDVVVTLHDTPCDNEAVLAMLKPETHQFYQNGVATFGVEKRAFCWRVSPDSQFVWILDEVGEYPPGIPVQMFVPADAVGV